MVNNLITTGNATTGSYTYGNAYDSASFNYTWTGGWELDTPKFKVGDRVKNICTDGRKNDGKHGKVTSIDTINNSHECIYYILYDDGENGCGNGRHYKLSNKPIMKKLNAFFKKFTDEKVQELVKAGYLNGDLEPTPKAHEAIKEILFFEKYDALVERAKEENKEAEAKKE